MQARSWWQLAVLVALVLSANAWAYSYVSAERAIYFWDFSLYWLKYGALGDLLRLDPHAALGAVIYSIATDDYNLVPLLPLMPMNLAFGGGRLPYVLAITNVSLVPAAALLTLVVSRASQDRSPARDLAIFAAILGSHVLWAPVLRGYPDAFGLVVLSGVLLFYFNRPIQDRSLLAVIGFGAMLALLVMTRRWYLFWAVSFLPSAVAAWLADGGWKRLSEAREILLRLAVAGVVCASLGVAGMAPVVQRIAGMGASSDLAAYGADLAGGALGQVAAHVGIAVLVISGAGLAWLIVQRKSRALGVLLVVQSVLAFALFTHVQGLLGPQHYYILLPALAVGLGGAIATTWSAKWPLLLRVGAAAGIFAVIGLSSTAVFSPTAAFAWRGLPSVRYPPMVRSDLTEIDRLLSDLAALKPKRVYVAASSETINWSVVSVACRERRETICRSIWRTEDVDTRDGFPRGVLGADYVIMATPTQYHLKPADQQGVGLVADEIREGKGIGAAFVALPSDYMLDKGVTATIYRRISPNNPEAVQAISEHLKRSHSGSAELFDIAS